MNKYIPERNDEPLEDRDLYELAGTSEDDQSPKQDSLPHDPRAEAMIEMGGHDKTQSSSKTPDQAKSDDVDMRPKELPAYCLKCAESLKGLPAGISPNCGREFDPQISNTISRTPIPIDTSLGDGWMMLALPSFVLAAGLFAYQFLPSWTEYSWLITVSSYPIWLVCVLLLFLRAIRYNKLSVKLFIMVLVGCVAGWPMGTISPFLVALASLAAVSIGAIIVMMQEHQSE